MLTIALLAVLAGPDAGRGRASGQLDSLNGFQNAVWGMSKEQVKEMFPGGADYETELVSPRTQVAGLDAVLVFDLDDAGLYQVRVKFQPDDSGTPTERTCTALREGLEAKYGTASDSQAQLGGGALSHWRGAKTVVELDCDMFPVPPNTKVTIGYVSAEKLKKKPRVKNDDL